MNYTYIDLGAYNGDSFLTFMARDDLIVSPSEFGCYLVEPNPKFLPILTNLHDKFENIKDIGTGAAWTDNGEMDYAQDQNNLAYGSTIMKSRTEIWETAKTMTVKTFDFSDWIKQFKDDYVIVKMDIEGAEFPILEKMLKDDTLLIMNELWG